MKHLAHNDWGQVFVRDINSLLKSPGSLYNITEMSGDFEFPPGTVW